ncbi:MAG: NTP transferase domain-containing protein [Hyphomicrobiaceae bacterium]|nr:NTP transferase domain-containing protein [Hyphomicrobiaceae bacterium]
MTVAAGPNAQIVPVILAGGIGRRLWPLSRIERPKQFLALDGPLSLFQNTLKRVADRRLFASPVVSTQESYRFLVAEQAAAVGIEPRSILLESEPTGTAFAIAAAASAILADGGDCHILVLPSDHRILDPGAFLESVRAGLAASAAGYLVTFGVTAEGPETGFGYIQAGATLPIGARPVDVFVEKPDALVAADWSPPGNVSGTQAYSSFNHGRF